MPNVTVAGASNGMGHFETVTVPYDTQSTYLVAKNLAGAITAGVFGGSIIPFDNKVGPGAPAVPAGETGEYVVSQSGLFSMPPGYANVVVTAPDAIVYGSGDANERILSGQGTFTFIAAAGSGTVAAGGGTNTISFGSGDTGSWGAYTGSGNDVILALNTGNDSIAAGGGSNSIQLGTGNDLIATTGSDVIMAGSGSETVGAIGSGSDVIYGMSSKLVFVGGSGSAVILGQSGSDTFFGGSGTALVRGGSAGNNVLRAGTGTATLFGGGSGDRLYAAGSASQALHAGAGNETLFGGFATGNDTFYAGSGADQITGSMGNDTFVGGTGTATIQAGFGSDVFQFIKGSAGGSEVVNGLMSASQVDINLVGYNVNEAHHAVDTQVDTPTSVTITLTDHTTVTFNDIDKLTLSNFS